MPATSHEVDMSLDDKGKPSMPKKRGRPAKSTSPKQLRARARRKQLAADEAIAALHKPLEQWDDEELARGRPRAKDGTFKGKAPQWINRKVHEEAIRRFQEAVRRDMNVHTIAALQKLGDLLDSVETDSNGKPIVPASVQADIAKFLIEHVVGKPTARVEQDISVKLQAVLGAAIVNPTPDGGTIPTAGFLAQGTVIDAESWEDDDDDDEPEDA